MSSTAAPNVPRRRRLRSPARLVHLRPRHPRGPRLPGGALARRLLARRPASWTAPRMAAAVVFGAILLAGLIAGPLQHWLGLKGPAVHDPSAVNLFGDPTGPSSAHPLGVDGQGRDVLSRMLYGLRSMVLLSLAGAGLGMATSQVLVRLSRAGRWIALLVQIVVWALRAFPPLLLGLALAVSLGPGAWRIIVVLAISQLTIAAPGRRELPGVAVRALAGAMTLDFGLTFLGDLPGAGPQLGAMVRQAGAGIVAGVPQWWALLFPGLVVMLALAAAWVLRPRGAALQLGAPPHWRSSTRRGYLGGELASTAARLICVFGLSALLLRGLGGSDPGGRGALAALGPAPSVSASLLGGAAAVWLAATLLQVWLSTRPRWRSPARTLRVPGRLIGLGATLLSAAPIGWLGFLALWLLSDSVGKLPILPGAATYVGLTHDAGRWAEALVIPWLLLGLWAAARLAPDVSRITDALGESGQQRVARAAGVPERRLARQLRRAVIARLPERVVPTLGGFLGGAVILEVAFVIPGAGRLADLDAHRATAATVSDLAALAAGVVVLAGLLAGLIRLMLDPGVVRR